MLSGVVPQLTLAGLEGEQLNRLLLIAYLVGLVNTILVGWFVYRWAVRNADRGVVMLARFLEQFAARARVRGDPIEIGTLGDEGDAAEELEG